MLINETSMNIYEALKLPNKYVCDVSISFIAMVKIYGPETSVRGT